MECVDFELIENIRDHINRVEKHISLLKNHSKWQMLVSSLDTIEDTAWAIEYYNTAEFPDDFKGKYLFVYGLLQSLFVQQDALVSICKALFDKDIILNRDYPDVHKVRELRNDVVGHPTSRRNSKDFIRLIQCDIRKYDLTYIKFDGEKDESCIEKIDVKKAIEAVSICVNSVLKKAGEDLDIEFEEYLAAHKERKMKEIFSLLSYAKEKTFEESSLSDWGYNETKSMVRKCEEELKLRYGKADAIDSYKYLLLEIHELYSLIDNVHDTCQRDSVELFSKYLLQLLFIKLHDLENLCEETDYYFQNNGVEMELCPIDGPVEIEFIAAN